MGRDPTLLWGDALLRATLNRHVEVLHHCNLATPCKLLIDMCLIHLLLDVSLETKGLLHLGSKFGHPRRLGPWLQLKVLIVRSSIDILRSIFREATLGMLLLLKELDLMNSEVVWRSEELSRTTNSPHRVQKAHDKRGKDWDFTVDDHVVHLMPQPI